jgi:3-oxoacyl-[acyl-carrier protein] reductase
MDTGLAGQMVLVTGASGGIGQACARAFATEGAAVALHWWRNEAAARNLAAELAVPTAVVGADLRVESEAEAMVDEAVRSLGRLDVVVVNAGVWEARSTPLHAMSLEQWQATMAADLTSVFLTCRAFLRHVAAVPREAASIVMIGSTAALFGEAGHADYAAAKAAMVYGLTRSLKNEIVALAPRGRVNAVCPGWTVTPMATGLTADDAAVARATATMALRKIGRPEDVAAAVVFLASDRLAGHVSGAIVPVAGGMEGRLLHDPHP